MVERAEAIRASLRFRINSLTLVVLDAEIGSSNQKKVIIEILIVQLIQSPIFNEPYFYPTLLLSDLFLINVFTLPIIQISANRIELSVKYFSFPFKA